jgi:hypothetical protein
VISNIVPNAQAQTFTPADKFVVPELNGTISFASNGSYSEATLENNTWVFKDLRLNIPNIPYFDLNSSQSFGNLKFSAQNSNVTIWGYFSLNNTSFPITMLGYSSEGIGRQKVNLGLNLSRNSDVNEWSVLIPKEVFVSAGKGWALLPDDTLLITLPANNVTIIYFSFIDSIDSTSVFYLQHSVAILVAVVSIVAITVGVLIRVRRR